MSEKTTNFQQALRRTAILITAALTITFIRICCRLPQSDLLIIVFSFLTAVRIAEIVSLTERFRILAGMLAGAMILQYTVGSTVNNHLLNVLLPSLAGYIILSRLPAASAHPVLLTGFLAYTASPGAWAAAGRAVDILIAGLVIWVITLPFIPSPSHQQHVIPGKTLSRDEAVLESLTIFCGTFLYKLLSMPQGSWIVLTIIFIFLARQPGESIISLIHQRIFSVPAGIILGGVFSGTLVMFDYRLAYLMPLIGALGFFSLYYKNDFFLFSLFFMFAFTIYSDWMSGTYREFNFWQFLFARSLATIIGTAILLLIEKSAFAGATGELTA